MSPRLHWVITPTSLGSADADRLAGAVAELVGPSGLAHDHGTDAVAQAAGVESEALGEGAMRVELTPNRVEPPPGRTAVGYVLLRNASSGVWLWVRIVVIGSRMRWRVSP